MERRNWIGVAVLVIGLAGIGTPATSSAQQKGESSEPTNEQKEDFAEFVQAGKEEYTAGNFEAAIPFFEKAYQEIPRPELHHRIALCYERSGHPKKALEYYRKFLKEKPETERRGAVEKTIARLEKQVEGASKAMVRIESEPSGARVRVEGEKTKKASPGTTPLEMSTAAGEMKVTLEKEGYEPKTRTLDVRAGETQSYSFELKPVPTDTGGRAEKRKGGLGTAATVGLVIGGIGVVGGGAFYGIGQHCRGVSGGKKNCTRGLYNGSVISSYVGGGLGVVGLGTAAVFMLTDSGGRPQKAASSSGAVPLRLSITPRSVGISGAF